MVRAPVERQGPADPEGWMMLAVHIVQGRHYVALRDFFRALLPDELPEGWGAAEIPGLIEVQGKARRFIEGQIVEGGINLVVIGSDGRVTPLPEEARKSGEADSACFDFIDWEGSAREGVLYLRSVRPPPILAEGVLQSGQRPALYMLATEAKSLLKDWSNHPKSRALAGRRKGGAMTAEARRRRAEEWQSHLRPEAWRLRALHPTWPNNRLATQLQNGLHALLPENWQGDTPGLTTLNRFVKAEFPMETAARAISPQAGASGDKA